MSETIKKSLFGSKISYEQIKESVNQYFSQLQNKFVLIEKSITENGQHMCFQANSGYKQSDEHDKNQILLLDFEIIAKKVVAKFSIHQKICLGDEQSPEQLHTPQQTFTKEIPVNSKTLDEIKLIIPTWINTRLPKSMSLNSFFGYNSHSNLAKETSYVSTGTNIGAVNDCQKYSVYPGGICFAWSPNQNLLTIVSDPRQSKMDKVNPKKFYNMNDFDKFTHKHQQDASNIDNLDILFGDEWSEKIHEIPPGDIWNDNAYNNFLSFVFNKKDEVNAVEKQNITKASTMNTDNTNEDNEGNKSDARNQNSYSINPTSEIFEIIKPLIKNHSQLSEKDKGNNTNKITIENLRIFSYDNFLASRRKILRILNEKGAVKGGLQISKTEIFNQFYKRDNFLYMASLILEEQLCPSQKKCFLTNFTNIDEICMHKLWELNIKDDIKNNPDLMFASFVLEVVMNHFKFVKIIAKSLETADRTSQVDNQLLLLQRENFFIFNQEKIQILFSHFNNQANQMTQKLLKDLCTREEDHIIYESFQPVPQMDYYEIINEAERSELKTQLVMISRSLFYQCNYSNRIVIDNLLAYQEFLVCTFDQFNTIVLPDGQQNYDSPKSFYSKKYTNVPSECGNSNSQDFCTWEYSKAKHFDDRQDLLNYQNIEFPRVSVASASTNVFKNINSGTSDFNYLKSQNSDYVYNPNTATNYPSLPGQVSLF